MSLAVLELAELRHDGFSHADKVRFLELFHETKNPFSALELLQVSSATYYYHLQRDEWFAREVCIAKKRLAWARTPRLVEIADGNTGGNVTANIWLQKVLGGDEFNPDRRSDAAVVSLTYAPTVIQHLSKPSLLPSSTLLTAAATETTRRRPHPSSRRCHCGRRGPHKSSCRLRQQRREAELLQGKGCGLEGEGGNVTLPQLSHHFSTQKAP